jgi:hypothetical protein
MLPKEYTWFINHPEISAAYSGEYIAIIDESVVAHGKNFKQVLEEAEKKYGKTPFIHKVPNANYDLVV